MTEDREKFSEIDPEELARNTALQEASQEGEVGEFVTSRDAGDGVTDYRFKANIPGYESWQWSVTLYHDVEAHRWTVDESSLIPAEGALLPPKWVPWKERLLPEDLSVTDVMGTEDGDSRLEDGFRRVEHLDSEHADSKHVPDEDGAGEQHEKTDAQSEAGGGERPTPAEADAEHAENEEEQPVTEGSTRDDSPSGVTQQADSEEDLRDAVEELHLARRTVLSPLGRSEAAKRWYAGQGGPKSLSTKTAEGHTCDECGFYIPLSGELGTMFGVCANRWSPDDGRVVSLDHGGGEHSDITPPEMNRLWVQSEPAFDDLHIDIVKQGPRDERPEIEMIERLQSEDGSDQHGSDQDESEE